MRPKLLRMRLRPVKDALPKPPFIAFIASSSLTKFSRVERKAFFFEKKNQKTFVPLACAGFTARAKGGYPRGVTACR
jgi:hypothetical protein